MASPPEDYGAERALAPSAGGAVLFSPVSPAQAQAAALEAQLVQPTLFSYVANDLVWARASSKATDPFWPVRVVALGSLANGVVESKSIIRSSRDERASLPSRRPRRKRRPKSLSRDNAFTDRLHETTRTTTYVPTHEKPKTTGSHLSLIHI